jgi:hypothetical protein
VRRLPAPGSGHEPWTGPPKGDMGGPGMTGLLGIRPPEQCRSARPRVEARGRGVCSRNQVQRATGATDARSAPCGAPASSANAPPRRSLQPRPWQRREAPSGISESDSTAAAGGIREGMTGGEDEPESDGS